MLNHNAALRAIGATKTRHSNRSTEYWNIPESKEVQFYNIRESIPFNNLLCGFRESGFIVYLDQPKDE